MLNQCAQSSALCAKARHELAFMATAIKTDHLGWMSFYFSIAMPGVTCQKIIDEKSFLACVAGQYTRCIYQHIPIIKINAGQSPPLRS